MFKIKISLMLVIATLAYLASSYLVLAGFYRDRFREDLVRELRTSERVLVRAKRLDEHMQVAVANEFCAWSAFVEKFAVEHPEGIEGKDARHQDIWEELSVWDSKLKARAAKQKEEGTGRLLEDEAVRWPDMMYVTDATGEGVAKLTDYSWWGLDISKQFPIVKTVGGTGKGARDLWLVEGQMVEVSVCPLTGAEGKFVGSVILGWILSDGVADHFKTLTGDDVAFFHNDRVTAGTMGPLALQEVQRDIVSGEAVHEVGRLSSDREFKVRRTTYVGTAALFQGYQSNASAGFVLLADLDAALAPIGRTAIYNGVGGGILIIILVGGALLLLQQFTAPLVDIDAGIHEIINGNFDYNFPVEEKDKETLAGAMAHSLNLVSCILQGKEIPEDEEGDPEGWEGDPLFVDEVSQVKKRPEMSAIPGLAPPPKKELPAEKAEASVPAKAPKESIVEPAAAPVAEPEPEEERSSTSRVTTIEQKALHDEGADSYYKRLFQEYVDARQENGEPTANIKFEKFREKLLRNEAAIRKKLNCGMVRFRVQTKAGKVSLKPIPLD